MATDGVAQRSWPALALGALTGILAAGSWDIDGAGTVLLAVIGGVVGHLLDCACLPLQACWMCKGREFLGDRRGKLRERPCWRCGRERIIRRFGARLIGAQGRRSR